MHAYLQMFAHRYVQAGFGGLPTKDIDFCSKKQNTVETSTYGSEFVAARTATDHSAGSS